MKRTLLAAALCAAFAAPAVSFAAQEEASPLTANIGLFSSYRFRGIDQTFGKSALQGGFDYAHASGFYLGNWNSNVNEGAGYPGGNLEMDFYGGYKTSFGDLGLDLGAIYYYYPGSEARGVSGGANNGTVDNKEVYVGASWKFVSLKYSYAVDDYFATRAPSGEKTRGTSYLDLSANYDLGNGWGVNAHVGRLDYKNFSNADYTDWKLGVTKDVNGWIVGVAYVGTNANGSCPWTTSNPYCFANSVDNGNNASADAKFKDAGRGIAVVSVSRTF
ncbi:TorF family putative porin [Rhodocyclus purpureus]|uniref:TorF family putative porin n=1 Tax=Rhodocyclus purpureus TaxID=1067 RepID=UPI001912CCA2|nr:TorF family putative porin [Rhodocyclus purpureus]MBK5914087.1 hypothetical protein [Rhodocyclus purpureus]